MKIKKIRKTNKSELATKIMAYGTTAAGLLAVAQPASAAIVYSGPQNLPLAGNTTQNIDLNNDGSNDFYFEASAYTTYNGGSYFGQDIQTSNSNQFIQSDGNLPAPLGNSDAANLPLNYIIQSSLLSTPNMHWNSGGEPLAGGTYSTHGSFRNTSGYIGVRFHSAACAGADWNYGWIQFSNTGFDNSTIIDWAYEDTCNTSILAGAGVPTPATEVPTLGQWGMLIMTGLLSGAAIYRMRKDQKKA